MPIMNQYIFWFQVSVHDVMPTENFETFQDLPQESDGFGLGKKSIFVYQFVECSPIAEFVNEIKIIRCFKHIDIVDDVLALIPNLGQDVDFVYSALFQFWYVFKLLRWNHLNCKLLSCFNMLCFVNLCEVPLPQGLLDHIIFHGFYHPNLILLFTIIIIGSSTFTLPNSPFYPRTIPTNPINLQTWHLCKILLFSKKV